MWDLEVDPVKHAHKMIAHIDRKRKDLDIAKAIDRIMVNMADRRSMARTSPGSDGRRAFP